MIHQESGASNLQQITLNQLPLFPKLVLWFQISWGDLIIIPLIMVMFRFTLQSIHLNLPLNIFLNPDTTPIKSIDDYEMDQLLGLFHSENDDDLLNVNLQMFQA